MASTSMRCCRGCVNLGISKARTSVIEFRSSDGRDDRFPDLATELIRLNVDLIVTRGTPAALAAKRCNKSDPHSHGGNWRSC